METSEVLCEECDSTGDVGGYECGRCAPSELWALVDRLTRERDEAREQVDALLAVGVRDLREDVKAGIGAPTREELSRRAEKAEAEVERLRAAGLDYFDAAPWTGRNGRRRAQKAERVFRELLETDRA